MFIINSRYADIAEHWFNKTFRNEEGISGASAGRADQWKMAGLYLVSGEPLTILIGYKPGKAPEFSREYSTKVNAISSMFGRSYQLHSLYLNMLIEYGLVAFIVFIWFFIKRWRDVNLIYKQYGNTIPLLALIGYMIYIGSVSGLGIIPGMFISLFLINHDELISLKDFK